MDPNTILRVMYGAAILGAGLVGVVTLFAPTLASRFIFFGGANVDVYVRILGAVWLSLGAVSVLGLISPRMFIPVLLIQLVYKSCWLLFAAYPALLAGAREVGLMFFAGLFSIWVLALLLVIPFDLVFSDIG